MSKTGSKFSKKRSYFREYQKNKLDSFFNV